MTTKPTLKNILKEILFIGRRKTGTNIKTQERKKFRKGIDEYKIKGKNQLCSATRKLLR
jgi:hypothetical protein